MGRRDVLIVLFEGVQPLDVVGPHEVFAGANAAVVHRGQPAPYRVQTVAIAPGVVRGESGLGLVADGTPPDPRNELGTLLIPGGHGARSPEQHPELVEWIQSAAPQAARIATVCTGAFLAAAAGLCAGRRVTTHWAHAGELASAYPSARVSPDALHCCDGNLWSSAGVTAGIDLALALVEHDCGASVAQTVARHLVVHVRRPGGQTQFAAPVWSKPPETDPIRTAIDAIHSDPAADLSLDALATAAGLSTRHFVRRFRAEVGEPAGSYVERVRVEAARRLLEDEVAGLEIVAKRTGFGTTETLRRAFQRRVGMPPALYRRIARSNSRPV
ncbi:MAG: DJ-1/PfpI family protein [Acidimicrobiales bacterium]|nr:DJ-1/PfpI family protein [Acidimicrobiales bacterium]